MYGCGQAKIFPVQLFFALAIPHRWRTVTKLIKRMRGLIRGRRNAGAATFRGWIKKATSLPGFIRGRRDAAVAKIRAWISKAQRMLRVGYARTWKRGSDIWIRLTWVVARHGVEAGFTLLITLIAATAYWLPTLQEILEPQFATSEMLGSLRTVVVTIGGALIGAAAIAFSFIMFALQVNVERMPHGLFRRLSTDSKLIAAFTAIFLLATTVATLSMIPDISWLATAAFGTGWGIILILALFHFAFRRALFLINPVQQLRLVAEGAQKDMRLWVRRAQRAAPLLVQPDNEEADVPSAYQSTHDYARITFFKVNPSWTREARRAVTHAISFARRYAEQGDYEVSSSALNTIVRINAAYIEAKGKTFFSQNPLFNVPFATDGFFNESLEFLRQNLRLGVARGDEQQIEQTIQTMALLSQVYLKIDYSAPYASKTHAHIAASYLSGAVDSILPHNMADVLMEWMRLMGQTARSFIVHGDLNDIVPLTEKIGIVAGACTASERNRPVTLGGMEQLAELTLTLIRSEGHDSHFAFGEVTRNVTFVAKFMLALPDTPFSSIHSTYLGPYYSGTSPDTLLHRLNELANALVNAPADDEHAQSVIRNIAQWTEELNQTEKELFLYAIEKKSHFTFDVINWIVHVTKILLAVSNAEACSEHSRDDLRQHALSLVFVLGWVPDEEDAVRLIENLQITETLFDTALDAHQRDCDEVSLEAGKILMSWAFKAAKYQTGWRTLLRSMYALTTLAILRGGGAHNDQLKQAVSRHLVGDNAPDQEYCDNAARELRSKAATLDRQEFRHSGIEHVMHRTDHARVAPLLNEIADILSPDTASEPV